ncbi:MAG: D-glycero-beta-D-manno-heptose 1-phosphate adenylyltransferase [Verrucomicrobiota bacterium]|jgi:rfaE bifunctional protein nucleotidyltransferase chain/domain
MTQNKIVSVSALAKEAESFRATGKRLVVTNGCFDLLHVGHVRYLQAARALGDALAIALNSDASVRSLKGEGRPLNSEHDRAEVLAALNCVDYVSIFSEMRATQFLETVRPAVYAKGGDYKLETLDRDERAALEKIGAAIKILPLEPGYSTSRLIERLQKR